MRSKVHRKNYKGPSVGDLSAELAKKDEEGTLTPGELKAMSRPHNAGRGIHRELLKEFAKLSDVKKHNLLLDTWKEIAMGTAARAKAFVATCSSKEFHSLAKMINAGTEALEAAYPKQQPTLSAKLIVNMFGSLGQRAVAIAQPPVPMLDITPQEETWPTSDTTKTTPSLLTSMETSPTTTPSTPS